MDKKDNFSLQSSMVCLVNDLAPQWQGQRKKTLVFTFTIVPQLKNCSNNNNNCEIKQNEKIWRITKNSVKHLSYSELFENSMFF